MLSSVVLAASLGLTPVYLSSGEPVGQNSLGVNLEVGFPWSTIWATYGITDRIDAGIRLASADFYTESLDLIVRGEIWHGERLRITGKLWGGWTSGWDPFSDEVLAAEGPWGVGGLITFSGHAGTDGLGLYVSVGGRAAFRPYVVCYSCGSSPDVYPGHGTQWSALGLVGFELPVASSFALHIEIGAEARFNWLDSSFPIVPFPMIDGGLTWHW